MHDNDLKTFVKRCPWCLTRVTASTWPLHWEEHQTWLVIAEGTELEPSEMSSTTWTKFREFENWNVWYDPEDD